MSSYSVPTLWKKREGSDVTQLAGGWVLEYAEVLVRVVMPKNDFLLNFRLFERAGDWLVYDVMVNGMSLIDNYRAQFVRTLDTMPYEQLIGRIQKTAELPLPTRDE